jgi:hypothetical protein
MKPNPKKMIVLSLPPGRPRPMATCVADAAFFERETPEYIARVWRAYSDALATEAVLCTQEACDGFCARHSCGRFDLAAYTPPNDSD